MIQESKEALMDAGINLTTAMNRFFNNEQMYFSFLVKFSKDELMGKLKEHLESGDIELAFQAAHTLKGVCANLSIDAMNEILNPMVEVLRGGKADGMMLEYEKLLSVYNDVINVIKTYC